MSVQTKTRLIKKITVVIKMKVITPVSKIKKIMKTTTPTKMGKMKITVTMIRAHSKLPTSLMAG
jgi:hypothetical protein